MIGGLANEAPAIVSRSKMKAVALRKDGSALGEPRSYEAELRSRLVFWVIVVTIIGGVIDAAFTFRANMQVLQDFLETESSWALRLVEDRIASVRRDVASVARLPWGADGYNESAMTKEAGKLLRGSPDFAMAGFFRQDGSALVAMRAGTISRFEHLTTQQTEMISKLALRPAEVAIGPEYLDQAEKGEFPVIAPTTQDSLWFVATVRSAALNRALSAVNLSDGTRAFVLDENGFVLSHSVSAWVGRRLELGPQEFTAAAYAVWSRGIAGDTVLRMIRPLPKTTWLVGVEYPISLVLNRLIVVLYRSVILAVAGIVFAFLFSRHFARKSAAPIALVTASARALAAGDLSVTVVESGPLETRALAAAFNSMAFSLKDSYEGLAARVAEKTSDLANANQKLEIANKHKSDFLAHNDRHMRVRAHHLHAPRLNLSQIQNLVDQSQQMLPRIVDVLHRLRLFLVQRAEILRLQHFGETNHRVERRAQFMRHVGEKIAFVFAGDV